MDVVGVRIAVGEKVVELTADQTIALFNALGTLQQNRRKDGSSLYLVDIPAQMSAKLADGHTTKASADEDGWFTVAIPTD